MDGCLRRVLNRADYSAPGLGKATACRLANGAAEIAARPTWLLRSSGPVMKAFLEGLRNRHGSIENYLFELDVDGETLDTLRARLLEP